MYTIILLAFSIALTSYLAVTSVYYGGPALGKGTAKAISATIISQGQQISGMAQLYYSDTTQRISSLSDLTTQEYLSSIPSAPAALGAAWTLDTSNNLLTITTTDDISEICLEVERARNSSIADLSGSTGDTSGGTPADYVGQFGCMEDSTTAGTYQVYYSL